MRKGSVQVVIILGIIILIGGGIIFFPKIKEYLSSSVSDISHRVSATPDIGPIDDSDLRRPPLPVLSDSDNSYYNLEKVSIPFPVDSTSSKEIDDFLRGVRWNDALVKGWLDEGKESLNNLEEAAKKKGYRDPSFIDIALHPDTTSTLTMNPAEELRRQRLFLLSGWYMAKHGDVEGGLATTLKVMRIGQQMEKFHGTLIAYLIGDGIERIALESAQAMIVNQKLSKTILVDYQKNLSRLKPDLEDYKAAIKSEYMSFTRPLLDQATLRRELQDRDPEERDAIFVNLDNPYYFKINTSKKLIVDTYRDILEEVGKPCSSARHFYEELSKSLNEFRSGPQMNQENGIGIYIFYSSMPAIDWTTLWCRGSIMVYNVTQLTLAVKAYHIDTGIYPASLDQLVPKYIGTIPSDPFDGKPLRYSKEKKIIYSVGTSTKDVGGSTGTIWQNMENPTFKIEF